jgi:hypothetical protein
MNRRDRVLTGAFAGFLATFLLSGLRKSLAGLGAIYTTAPEQVVRRAEELDPRKELSPWAKKAMMVAAHFAYGTGAGAVFGALRAEPGEPENEAIAELRGDRRDTPSEAAVGAAPGVLSWGAGWAGWLPIAGVHPAPWTQRTTRAPLPVIDHAALGAAWGLIYWKFSRRKS